MIKRHNCHAFRECAELVLSKYNQQVLVIIFRVKCEGQKGRKGNFFKFIIEENSWEA